MKFLTYIVALLCASVALAFTGTESSGGGPSLFCPQASIPQEVVRLYDFFEGNIRLGLNIPVTNGASKEVQAEWALKKLEALDYAIAQDVRSKYLQMSTRMRYLPDGILMTGVNDLGSGQAPLILANCQLVYAAFYENSGVLSVSRTIFDRFTETEKAALLMHEAIYAVAREQTAQTDSRSTRILNAYLFSSLRQPSQIVLSSLLTMKNPNFGLIIPLIRAGSNNGLNIRASCGNMVSQNDYFRWGSDVSLWSSSGATSNTAQGFLTPRISVDLNTSYLGESLIPFNFATKAIIFKNSQVYRSGTCVNEALEIFYGNKKIAKISAQTTKFTVRIF